MSRQFIRVNLQFGPRTDSLLWTELASKPPYVRAKLVRQLLLEAIRYRTGTPVPSSQANAAAPLTSGESPDGAFSNNVAALLGKSLRL